MITTPIMAEEVINLAKTNSNKTNEFKAISSKMIRISNRIKNWMKKIYSV